MTTICKWVGCWLACCSLAACAEADNKATEEHGTQWKLPKALREISGLEHYRDNWVLAIQDESAYLYLIDAITGTRGDVYSLGNPAVKGDFEGVALHNDIAYLITSNGKLYAANFDTATKQGGKSLAYEVFDLKLASTCEIEGLTAEPNRPILWIACKTRFHPAPDNSIQLHAWSTTSQAPIPDATRTLPAPRQKKFSASGLAFTPNGQRLLLVAAKQKSYAWYSWGTTSQLIKASKLPKEHKHPQTEGVTILPQGGLVVADEGKKKAGRLTHYPKLW